MWIYSDLKMDTTVHQDSSKLILKIMKKNIFLFIALMLVGVLTNAQNTNIKKANKLFNLRAYSEAASIYESESKTQESLQKLADSYYYINNMDAAVKAYQELISKFGPIQDKEQQFRYGQALKGIGNYESADLILSEYFGKPLVTNDFIDEITKNTPHVFELKKFKSESTYNDFGVSFYGNDKVTFASDRNQEKPIYSWNNKPYLDLYMGTMSESGELQDVIPFPSEINTKTHESNAIISKDGKTMYFNRTNSSRIKNDEGYKVANIKIYKAELIDSIWSNVKALPFTNDAYNTEHPTVSKDGRTMYFSSDMPGGFGSFDIYKIAINPDGTFGDPVNLGPNVNTSQREQFPFISEINVLYYASNGHQGFGGLDVFRSEMVNGEFTKALNLGKNVNSNLDDFGYVIKEKKNFGYLSSNRSGSDKSFYVSREENILTKYMVSGIVQDKNSKELLPGSLVTLFDDMGNVTQDTIVKEDASYLFKIEPNKKYKIRGTRKLYIPYDVEFSTDSKGKVSHDIYLILESYADAEERIKENEIGEVQVDLEKIFFDFNKWDIRPDAAETLQTLVDLMKKYPEMEVEVSAHTDARGPDEYNLNLSKKRASSTLDYLVSQGIEEERLKSIGYGEMQPLNKCIKEGICTDQEYDINRRCEFTLLN